MRCIVLINEERKGSVAPLKKQIQDKCVTESFVLSYLYILHDCQLFLLNAVKLLLVRPIDGGHRVILRSL